MRQIHIVVDLINHEIEAFEQFADAASAWEEHVRTQLRSEALELGNKEVVSADFAQLQKLYDEFMMEALEPECNWTLFTTEIKGSQ